MFANIKTGMLKKAGMGAILISLLVGPTLFSAAAQSTPDAPELTETDQDLTLNFNDVDIQLFIKFISDITGLNLVVDNRVKGKVTIFSPAGISVKEAYRVFESVLDVHGYAAVKSGQIVKILPQPVARTKNIETRVKKSAVGAPDRLVTQLVRLKYAGAGDTKRILTPLVSSHSALLAHETSGLLIITDLQSNLRRLLDIIQTIDSPTAGQKVEVFPLSNAKAAKIKPIITAMFTPDKTATSPIGKVQVQADQRTNTLIVMAPFSAMDKIKRLIGELDKQAAPPTGQFHVYYLENANAEALATTLKELTTTEVPLDSETADISGITQDIKIAADKTTNSLIVRCPPGIYELIEPIIQQLDIPRAMVYIEALIMEVSTDKDFRLGTEWASGTQTDLGSKQGAVYGAFSGGSAGGDAGFSTLGSAAVSSLPAGLSIGVLSELVQIGDLVFPNIGAVVQAYKKDKDVHILSTPQLLTTDNEPAQITVGKNVPFQTQATTSENNTFNSFEYRDVGKILNITPHISQDRTIRLKLTLEVTDVESNQDFRPTTLKRTLDTTILVKDKHTVVIGGLIDEGFSDTTYQVPCLGDIPLAGWAFKSAADIKNQTNLYVFLTPHVVKNDQEAQRLMQSKQEQIEKVRNLIPKQDEEMIEKLK